MSPAAAIVSRASSRKFAARTLVGAFMGISIPRAG
jgi:hypothetical protein